MTGFEPLARASAFLIASPQQPSAHACNWRIVTSQHVTHPWRFPNYYPQEFVSHLSERDVKYTLDVRNAANGEAIDGTVATVHAQHSTTLPQADMSLCSFTSEAQEAAWSARCAAVGILPIPCTLADAHAAKAAAAAALVCEGHFVEDCMSPNGQDVSKLRPRTVAGRILGRSSRQVFMSTAVTLQMGMCGGPVLVGDSDVALGVVEGIVPLATPSPDTSTPSSPEVERQQRARQLLGGSTAFIDAALVSHELLRSGATRAFAHLPHDDTAVPAQP